MTLGADKGLRWSRLQTDIFEDIADGEGNTVIQARAGCAKTTTLVAGMRSLDPALEVLVTAFNKGIEQELTKRVPPTKDIEVRTLHGFGFKTIRRAFRSVDVAKQKGRDIAVDVEEESNKGKVAPRIYRLAALGKNTLARSAEDLVPLAISHGLEGKDCTAKELAGLAWTCMERALEDESRIDFDDMVWFPAAFGLEPDRFDLVMVDETQDLNAAQLYMVMNAVSPGGRVIAVGDERQAIYGFRGADPQAMTRMQTALSAKTLPLSITYRCARSIVRYVNQWVPDFTAAPGAPEGVVRSVGYDQMLAEAAPGDFVLSRVNAPLLAVCLNLIRRRIPATVLGKDIGESLARLARRPGLERVPDLMAWLNDFRQAERERLTALDRLELLAGVEDRIAAVCAVSEGFRNVTDVCDQITAMFSNDREVGQVTCSSTHKSKGLERDRVWMLERTYSPGKSTEETNLAYVAASRAKTELCLVAPSGAEPVAVDRDALINNLQNATSPAGVASRPASWQDWSPADIPPQTGEDDIPF